MSERTRIQIKIVARSIQHSISHLLWNVKVQHIVWLYKHTLFYNRQMRCMHFKQWSAHTLSEDTPCNRNKLRKEDTIKKKPDDTHVNKSRKWSICIMISLGNYFWAICTTSIVFHLYLTLFLKQLLVCKNYKNHDYKQPNTYINSFCSWRLKSKKKLHSQKIVIFDFNVVRFVFFGPFFGSLSRNCLVLLFVCNIIQIPSKSIGSLFFWKKNEVRAKKK